jgi:hypothetical protein
MVKYKSIFKKYRGCIFSILLFIISTNKICAQKNEIELSYFFPVKTTLPNTGFINPSIISNKIFTIIYNKKIWTKKNSNLYFNTGFELAFLELQNTYNYDNKSITVIGTDVDYLGLKIGLRYKAKLFSIGSNHIDGKVGYNVLLLPPLSQLYSQQIHTTDSTYYQFSYYIDDNFNLINHSFNVGFNYNFNIFKSVDMSVGIDLLYYINPLRRLTYFYTSESTEKTISNYDIKYLSFGVPISFIF